MIQRILILNGPNLNRLGKRQPEVYGTTTMAQILLALQQAYPYISFSYRQSNHEGQLIDTLQALMEAKEAYDTGDTDNDYTQAVVLNPGGLCHSSVSLRDAVEETVQAGIPVVEVHISDITRREPFRQHSLLTAVCPHAVIGQGTNGYHQAVQWIVDNEQR